MSPKRTMFDLLYDVHQLARNSDPESSHEAAERVAKSERRKTHCDRLAAVVQRYPKRSSAWYAKRIGMDRVEAARRMADLDNANRVTRHRGPDGKPMRLYCPVSKMRCLAWVPVYSQGEGLTDDQ